MSKNNLKTYGLPIKLRARDIQMHFGIGLSTVWHYAKQKKLNGVKISSRCTVFDRDEVLEFFNGK